MSLLVRDRLQLAHLAQLRLGVEQPRRGGSAGTRGLERLVRDAAELVHAYAPAAEPADEAHEQRRAVLPVQRAGELCVQHAAGADREILVDDGQGWKTPEPAGVCDFCTPAKNKLAGEHTRQVINPFLKSLRGKVGLVLYSLPGKEDPIRKKLYRSFSSRPSAADRKAGRARWRRYEAMGHTIAHTALDSAAQGAAASDGQTPE